MVTMATMAMIGMDDRGEQPGPRRPSGVRLAITRSAARSWRVPSATRSNPATSDASKPVQFANRRSAGPRNAPSAISSASTPLTGADDVRAFGLGHGRLDGADVPEDGGSFFERERAADDHDRLDGRAVERRVPIDHP
jgi:hypothetical protein